MKSSKLNNALVLALFGHDAMSDLSPESAPKRTFANAFEPRKKVGRGEVIPARLEESAP
jgi:hypothetical protein